MTLLNQNEGCLIVMVVKVVKDVGGSCDEGCDGGEVVGNVVND